MNEHYRYTCQDPSFVPVALAGDGKWLVSGSKFDSSGNIVEDNILIRYICMTQPQRVF